MTKYQVQQYMFGVFYRASLIRPRFPCTRFGRVSGFPGPFLNAVTVLSSYHVDFFERAFDARFSDVAHGRRICGSTVIAAPFTTISILCGKSRGPELG